MGDPPQPKIPRLLADVEITNLPLGPMDGFVLSRIDGRTSIDDIADMTGLAPPQVLQVIESLIGHGVAEWVTPATPRPAKPRGSSPPGSRSMVRTKPPPPGTSRTLYDPQELEEPDVDLDTDRRRTILDTFYRLDEMHLYELLGVEPSADRKEIRSAYFELSKRFHPDTLYGKRLGTYKAKMEAVFKRLTEAYDTLRKKKTRHDYDAYMRLRYRTLETQESLEQAEQQAKKIHEEVTGEHVLPTSPPSDSEQAASQGVSQTLSKPPPPIEDLGPPRPRSDEAKARGRELAKRKLAGISGRRSPLRPPPMTQEPSTPVPPIEKPSRGVVLRGLAASLKQAAAVSGGTDSLRVQLTAAKRAEEDGDFLGAANALRLAVAMGGDRPDVAKEYARVRQVLAVTMAGDYEQRARYEERNKRWGDAALSWSKVCEGRPDDSSAHIHAAQALVEAAGDLQRAKTLAQRAVDLAPQDPKAHRAMGRVFHAAGMRASARTALEKAAKLDPEDEIVKNLLRELA